MRLVSKHRLPENEKCPKCLMIFSNFAQVSDDLLGCLKCGCVFIRSEVRNELSEHQAKILVEQDKVIELPVYRCECGFEAKNNVGLAAHQRHCKYLMENHESGSRGN